jgi:short-subunit dehydrogenase
MSRTVLITGCSSGLGLSITKKILEQSCTVVGLSRTDPSNILQSEYFHFERCNLNEIGIARVIFKRILNQYPEIDTIICNASTARMSNFEELSEIALIEMIQVNFTSHLLLVKTFLPIFKTRHSNIIFISSPDSPHEKEGNLYLAIKLALESFTESLRNDNLYPLTKITILHPTSPYFSETLGKVVEDVGANFCKGLRDYYLY